MMGLKRKPPLGDMRRVRSTGQNLCGVITNKAHRLVQFESFAERSLLLRFDRDKTIKDYASQPETFAYLDNLGKPHRYTPDFIVWRVDETDEIHEVTHSQRMDMPHIQERHAAAQTICEGRGWSYHLHTEHDLPQGAELTNLLALYPYRAFGYTDVVVVKMLGDIDLNFPMSLNNFTTILARSTGRDGGVVWGAVLHLLWHGHLETDWHQPIIIDGQPSATTLVWLPFGGTKSCDRIR